MDYTEIAYEVADRVLTITLDRPERLNAFTYVMHQELLDALDRADHDDDVRMIVVTGRGRGFCAGADLGAGGGTFDTAAEGAAIGGGKDATQRHRDEGGLVALRIFQLAKPIIAAINGPAVGVGVTMTLPMDVRLAAESARFGFVFARRGIVPEACSSWFLPRVVGISRAMEWTMTGRVFPAAEARDAGLVRAVLPDDELLPAAYALAREVVDNTSAVSVALVRQMMWRMLGEAHPMAAHRIDSAGIDYMGASVDAREGVVAFLEKRPATFTMSVNDDLPPFYPWWEEPAF